MSLTSFTKHLKISALAVAVSLSLAACTSTTDESKQSAITTQEAFSTLTKSQTDYQMMLDDADEGSRFEAMILVARSAIAARDYNTAQHMISSMQTEATTPVKRDQAAIMEGLLLTSQNKNTDALFKLNRIKADTLPRPVASFFYQLASRIESNLYQENRRASHIMKATEYRIALLNLLGEKDQKTVCMQTVKALQMMPASELTVQLNKSNDVVTKGFIDYALLDSSTSTAIKQQLVKNWMSNYSGHPLMFAAKKIANKAKADDMMDNDMSAALVSLKEGDKLAVLLPLTGRFAASVGEPARLGILAALQDRNSDLKVTFYDTNRFSMAEIASSLGQNGTNFIIGPILKPEVDALIETKIKLPAVVFNQPASQRAGMYYFNLGPDYEGALAASKIYYDGHVHPIVIAPESTRGQRATAGFNEVWQNAHSKSAISCRYSDVNSIASALTTCPLGNADSVYINATANEVIKIRPSIPANTPLYLTDRSYMGLNHSSSEVSLAGAYLGDMPWLLTDSALKKDLMSTLPEADSQIQRIFAVAYDSINFSFNLEKLAQDQSDVLHGISGDLQLGDKGLIEMAPMWVKLSTNRAVQ